MSPELRRVDQGGDGLLRAAARLYYIDGLAESRVAEIMGISRSKVSRILAKARAQGVVRFVVDSYDPRDRALEGQLRSRLRLRHAVVINPLRSPSVTAVRKAIGYFAGAAAGQLVRPHSVVGVAGGRVLAELVQYMPCPPEIRGITVVPLMGNIGPGVTGIDAIELARKVAQSFSGSLYTINAPAFAPDPAAHDVFLAHDHVRSVWRLFHQMDTAFVGVGTLGDSSFIERGVLQPTDLEQLRDLGAVGEICGRFFDDQGRECATPYRHRVISIDLDELRERQEVVAATHGEEKAPAICAAVRGGIVKSLITDSNGAQAVLDCSAP